MYWEMKMIVFVFLLSLAFTVDGQGCVHNITGELSGSFTSPNYPRAYPRHIQCYWKVTVPQGYRIRVHFNDPFEVGNNQLYYDFLYIFDGGSDRATRLIKTNDRKKPNDFKTSGNQLYVHLSAKGYGGYQGFSLQFTAFDGSECSRNFSTLQGLITSPGYPNTVKEGGGVDCQWQIKVPKPYVVRLQFDVWEVTSECLLYVYKNANRSNIYMRWRGPYLDPRYPNNPYSMPPDTYLPFSWTIIRFSESCTRRYVVRFQAVRLDVCTRPQVPVFLNHTIKAQLSCSGCDGDAYVIGARLKATCPQGSVLRGAENNICVSDGRTSPIWSQELPYCTASSVSVLSVEGQESGVLLPSRVGALRADLLWVITAPDGSPGQDVRVLLQFRAGSRITGKQELTVHDGGSLQSPVLVRLTGNSSAPELLISLGSQLTVRFSSYGEVVDFNAEFKIVRCGGELSGLSSGMISPPLYHGKFAPNLNCTWKVSVRLGYGIAARVGEVEGLEKNRDLMSVYEPSYRISRRISILLYSISEEDIGKTVLTSGNTIFVKFSSMGNNPGTKAVIYFKEQPIETSFNLSARADRLQWFTSENYPGLFPSRNMTWHVRAPQNYVVQLYYNLPLDVGFTAQLKIEDGNRRNNNASGIFGGGRYNRLPNPDYIFTDTDYVIVRLLVVDGNNQELGFNLTYEATPVAECPRPRSYRLLVNGSFSSGSTVQLSCEPGWKLVGASSLRCRPANTSSSRPYWDNPLPRCDGERCTALVRQWSETYGLVSTPDLPFPVYGGFSCDVTLRRPRDGLMLTLRISSRTNRDEYIQLYPSSGTTQKLYAGNHFYIADGNVVLRYKHMWYDVGDGWEARFAWRESNAKSLLQRRDLCMAPIHNPNASVPVFSSQPLSDGIWKMYPVNTTVRWSCPKDWSLVRDSEVTCTWKNGSDGQPIAAWNKAQPYCLPYTCGGEVQVDSARRILSPPRWPLFRLKVRYPGGLRCAWRLVDVTAGRIIRLDVYELQLYHSDQLIIYDGSNESANVLARFAHNTSFKYARPVLYSTGSTILIQLLPSFIEESSRGFSASYQALNRNGCPDPGTPRWGYRLQPAATRQGFADGDTLHFGCPERFVGYSGSAMIECSGSNHTWSAAPLVCRGGCSQRLVKVTSSRPALLYSLGWRSNSRAYTNCSWRLLAPPGTRLQVEAVELNFGSQYNSLKFYENGSLSHSLCGRQGYKNDILLNEPSYNTFRLHTNEAEVLYKSDSRYSGGLFKLRITAVDIDDYCEDPDTPQYGSRQVVPPATGLPSFFKGTRIVFSCNSGYTLLGNSETRCLAGPVRVWDKPLPTCKTLCGGDFAANSGSVYSPLWPLIYSQRQDCVWRIHTALGTRAAAKLIYLDLDSTSDRLYRSYLELRAGNNQSAPLLLNTTGSYVSRESLYTSHDNWLSVHFVSRFLSYQRNARGFHIQYTAEKPYDCSLPKSIDNLLTIEVANQTLFYKCLSGYTLLGANPRTCNSSLRQWNEPPPSCVALCGGMVSGSSGRLLSAGYPRSYRNPEAIKMTGALDNSHTALNYSCTWTFVKGELGQGYRLTLGNMWLEENDTLNIYDGDARPEFLLYTFNGLDANTPAANDSLLQFTSTGLKLSVVFQLLGKANSKRPANFSFNYQAVPLLLCRCPWPRNGDVRLCYRSQLVGAEVDLSCPQGLTLEGDEQALCGRGSQWYFNSKCSCDATFTGNSGAGHTVGYSAFPHHYYADLSCRLLVETTNNTRLQIIVRDLQIKSSTNVTLGSPEDFSSQQVSIDKAPITWYSSSNRALIFFNAGKETDRGLSFQYRAMSSACFGETSNITVFTGRTYSLSNVQLPAASVCRWHIFPAPMYTLRLNASNWSVAGGELLIEAHGNSLLSSSDISSGKPIYSSAAFVSVTIKTRSLSISVHVEMQAHLPCTQPARASGHVQLSSALVPGAHAELTCVAGFTRTGPGISKCVDNGSAYIWQPQLGSCVPDQTTIATVSTTLFTTTLPTYAPSFQSSQVTQVNEQTSFPSSIKSSVESSLATAQDTKAPHRTPTPSGLGEKKSNRNNSTNLGVGLGVSLFLLLIIVLTAFVLYRKEMFCFRRTSQRSDRFTNLIYDNGLE